ncbi:Na+/H+ antiporter NhaC family protein [Enterovibrio coralii]|uniref:Sodium:proton antiporter n=1 Tax=Enterovibrio coralii TaxID=294935 RepID=A0A135I316_9GAMM|nr:Na+/H+ antiporter NhaC family protein [Enterovibrio coralii]KXF79846.1 sodium:proton antiporter [Enterovibrio coralii]
MDANLLAFIPLILTLVLALVLRQTLVALGAGILAGAMVFSGFQPLTALSYLADIATAQLYKQGQWQGWHLNVIATMILLGVMTQLLARGGAVMAFGDWLYGYVRSPRHARLVTILLGWLVFIDGIFSCLAVGNVCQPLSDRYQIRREQLAYFVDSNASPLCALLLFSSWGPYLLSLLAGVSFLPMPPVQAFFELAQANFYAVLTIGVSLFVAWKGFGFEKPLPVEVSAPTQDIGKGNPWLLLVPMGTLLSASVGLTLYSGATHTHQSGLAAWLAAADIGSAMRNAALLAVVMSLVMMLKSGRRVSTLLTDLYHGVLSMRLAIGILLCTWMIGSVIKDLQVAAMIAHWAEAHLNPSLLVSGLFLLCATMAFATGSSWGTFAIMIPIGAEISGHVAPELLLPALSAVVAGSVFGDHCSPISDTSVLSATSSGCEPRAHVLTQLPFALTVAMSALIGFQMLNLGLGKLASWAIAIASVSVLLMLLQWWFNRKQAKATTGSELPDA